MKLSISTIFIVLVWMNLGAISIAQSGGTVFQDYCSGCHASDLTSDNIVTGNAVAPALGPYVEQFSAAVFVANIRNDRLLAPPMRTFEGELSDDQLRGIWSYITGVTQGDLTRAPRSETPQQRQKREKCEAIKTRMDNPPDSSTYYYPPGHELCTCEEDGESYCRRTGLFGENIRPYRPGDDRHCKPWVWQSERDFYANYCRTVQMVGEVEMTIAPPPLPQASEKVRRAMKEQPLNRVLSKQRLKLPKTPQNTPAPATENSDPGPVPASAELRCRAGGNMRLEATRPTKLDWVPRWERRRGAEVERGGGKPDMRDEHWAFIVYATPSRPGQA